MDIISHALWTNLVFKDLPLNARVWAIGFGTAPDLISFLVTLRGKFLRQTLFFKKPVPTSIFPKYVLWLYQLTHSAIIWLAIFLLLKIFGWDFWATIYLAWGFHILLDIFTHNDKSFPTPILWPFSKFHFSGINAGNKWFVIFNYVLLAFLYLIVYFK